jgi:uncharacterized protein Yka (UPF0111/DUF47 family)
MKWHRWSTHVTPASKHDIEKVLMNQSELAQSLRDLTLQLQKANKEVQDKIKALTDAVGNSENVSQEVVDATNNLKVSAQALDDIVPDAAPPTVPPGTGLPPVP